MLCDLQDGFVHFPDGLLYGPQKCYGLGFKGSVRGRSYVDFCGLLEMVVESLHVLNCLFALGICDVRRCEAIIAFYLCLDGRWVMGIQEGVDGAVVGTVSFPGFAAVLF